MLEKWTPAIAAAALALAQAQPVPSEPDFSGRWKLVSSPPSGAETPETMTVMQTFTHFYQRR